MHTVSWGLVVAALHAVLRCGRSAGSCATWRDVAGYWHVSGRGGGLACHIEAVWRGLVRRVEAVWWVGGVLRDVAGSWRVLGRGGGLACHVEVAWRGLARRVEVTWQGLGVCWVRVTVSRRVAGSCAPCRDGVGASGGWALRAMLRWRGRVGGVLVCHVGSVRWVGGGGAGWRGFAFSRVLRAVLGRQGGLAVAGCWGRMEVARMHEWPATSKVLHAVLGGWVGSGGVLQAMSGWRVGAGTNGSSSHGRGDSNGLQC
ncbi:hypothetical protein EDB83DRAFT_2312815 [Lactarius deliciosus]|nr:hypothetical protein EDB83DRAFT_2312815 [Lactarius deliciosus]